jgi:predicted nucleotidyltransferase
MVSPNIRIDLPMEKVEAFCRKWKIREMSPFGSVLRPDFGPDSDVDVLVVFEQESDWSLFDVVRAQEELRQVFGRAVDLVEKTCLRNPFRRHEILRTHQVIYAA